MYIARFNESDGSVEILKEHPCGAFFNISYYILIGSLQYYDPERKQKWIKED